MLTRRVIRVVCLLSAAAAVASCARNPATGRSQLSVLSREQEIALGAQEMPKITQEFGGAYPDAEAAAYVREVGMRVAQQAEKDYPGIPWEFTLLNSNVLNAFALPGGKVFITTELASRFTSEAELAAVLGHECGHVTARHTDKRMAESTLLQGAASIAGAASGSEALGSLFSNGSGLLLLRFSRDDEREADGLGWRYMTNAGYSPRGMVGVMKVLTDAASGGGAADFTSTHPDPASRLATMQRWLGTAPRELVERSDPRWESDYRRRLLDRLGKAPVSRPAPQQQATPARRAR